jgi:hypothetical protein
MAQVIEFYTPACFKPEVKEQACAQPRSKRRYIAVGADGKVQFWGKRGWMSWNARCRGAH